MNWGRSSKGIKSLLNSLLKKSLFDVTFCVFRIVSWSFLNPRATSTALAIAARRHSPLLPWARKGPKVLKKWPTNVVFGQPPKSESLSLPKTSPANSVACADANQMRKKLVWQAQGQYSADAYRTNRGCNSSDNQRVYFLGVETAVCIMLSEYPEIL